MIARVAAIGAVMLAVVLVVVVFMGGEQAHTYNLLFQSAGQLVKGDDVQVGGRRVGSIDTIELTDDNQARIGVTVEEPFAPLHQGTEAIIRATSLSGVANRYIALTPGPQSSPQLDDDAELASDLSTTIIDLDQVLAALDDPTRKDLQKVLKGFATQFDGQGEQAGQAAEYFNPVLSQSRRFVQQLTADDGVLTDLLLNASKTTSALADRRDDLSTVVSATDATAGAIASEAAALDEALGALPTTLRRGNTTFVNLRSTLDDLDRLTDASLPATKELAPFLREFRPLVAATRPTIADLRTAISRKGANNDLTDATKKLPKLQKVASPALRNSVQALIDSQPVLEFFRPYAPDLIGWVRDFGQGASTYDANGHYARIAPTANAFSFNDNPAGGTLEAIPVEARNDQLDIGNMERCPGAASQVAPDGSNNWAASLPEGGCNPDQVPPGP